MPKTVAIIQVRMGSTRLPGKALMDLDGQPVLAWVVRACKAAVGIDEVVVATTMNNEDQDIVNWCKYHDTTVVCGSANDVLGRFVTVWNETGWPDILLRITGDEPFIDPEVISAVVRLQKQTGADYVSNIHPRTYPDGLDVECFTRRALIAAHKEATRPIDRDCVTHWIVRNAHRFSSEAVINPIPGMEKERWVLDTASDLAFCQAIAFRWQWIKGPPSQYDILNILDKEFWHRDANADHIMNERFYQALAEEPLYARTYKNSALMLARAEKTIPLGTQTFSKSKLQYPQQAPLFLTHGQGGLVWDVDGNEYVDLVGGLLPNILGYRDPDVDSAVRRQLAKGISFSLATQLEYQLAETLCRLIPCAEMVRFGKNGTDVTTAAIRLARAVTGRDYVLSSGYHGWADVFVGNDPVRSSGVPARITLLTTAFQYGDIKTARECLFTKDYACVIVEPETNPEFLMELRIACNATGTLLIFDEIITGFRFHLSGAQALYNVAPDLATFGKAMGNGMPISALVGRKEYMRHMEHICFSGTFFGETLSLAAAIATIKKLEENNVPQLLLDRSKAIAAAIEDMLNAPAPTGIVIDSTSPLTRLKFSDEDIKTLFMQEMIKNGVLIIASHNFCHAHSVSDMVRILKAYDATFAVLKDAIENCDVKSRIVGRSILPTANIRAAS